ncbi:MAG: type I methionyl aminopeptidase [Candidatus Omnitrophota bacterium]
MIVIKTPQEIRQIVLACQIVAAVMRRLKECLRPGILTEEIDQEAEKLLAKSGAVSAFKGYRGYPGNICISINEEIVHGIAGKRQIRAGDLVTLDVGANRNGYFGDASWTFPVGRVSPVAERLLAVGKEALNRGIAQAQQGRHLSDVSHAIQTYVESSGFSVVRNFVGHGVGLKIHEEPEIPNFGAPGKGPILKEGMVLAIEPMVNEGSWEAEILEDKWTAVTRDGKLSVHFEHTICVTKDQAQVLTDWQKDRD